MVRVVQCVLSDVSFLLELKPATVPNPAHTLFSGRDILTSHYSILFRFSAIVHFYLNHCIPAAIRGTLRCRPGCWHDLEDKGSAHSRGFPFLTTATLRRHAARFFRPHPWPAFHVRQDVCGALEGGEPAGQRPPVHGYRGDEQVHALHHVKRSSGHPQALPPRWPQRI